MNGNITAALGQDSRALPVSPCDAAYDQIRRESEEHESLLDDLISRLDPALQPAPPAVAGSTGPVAADDPVMSELHGRLIGTARRVRQQNSALRDILARLTL